ncbi:YT521-B-like domain-containing protein [Lyophyllum atratum]|nr:YT521-B-like domain-containing protein [Lyophyllum atratum]
MASQPTPPPPPVPASPPNSGGVRRHHTISSSSRAARNAAREAISEETQDQTLWNDDEPVDEDWVGGVGAVGEKSSLHRQSSLPTRYHRGYATPITDHGCISVMLTLCFQGAPQTGNVTPKTVNSLAAIAGHEGDEEPWNIAGGYSVEDEPPAPESVQHQQVIEAQSNNSPLSPHFADPHAPSPPPAASLVRRHVSLTYGSGVAGPRKMGASGLKRSGTLQAPMPPNTHNTTPPDASERVDEDEYGYDEESNFYEDEYAQATHQQQSSQGQQYAGSPIGRQSPWAPGNEWRAAGSSGFGGNQNTTIDDVQRALSALEIASNQGGQPQLYQPQQSQGNYQAGQSAHPPRFNPPHPPPALTPGMRNAGNAGNGNGRQLQLVTDLEGRKTPQAQGGGYMQQQQQYQYQQDNRSQTSGGSWDDNSKDRVLGNRSSNPNLQYGYQQGRKGSGVVPSVPPIPQQYQQQQQPRMGGSSYSQSGVQQQQGGGGTGQGQGFANAPIDVPSLIATKGYNPTNFDTRPQFARFFVIKSYTEDDVHKSLKYEIWSSTDPGNKRLDKAFKETAGRGPIYLFFSVNASGHFCGMAEMLTPVDYTRSSTVWASDKWKGVFTVRWIFVRDIPNVNLRHIKLNNTQERKPVTNSRDTQELLPDAGQEMLRIFHTHPARTSLLQDFAFYELQAMQKVQGGQTGPSSPGHSPDSGTQSPQHQHQQPQSLPQQHQHQQQHQQPQAQHQQNMFNLSPNPNALGYAMPQMTPMMQMQMMGMGMGMGANQYGMPQAQAMHQSVMRHPSPGPPNHGGQSFMGF